MRYWLFCAIFYAVLFVLPIIVGAIQINEIMYNLPGSDDWEWIELYQNDSQCINLSTWKLYESGSNHGLTLKQGNSTICENEYAIISRSTTQFLINYSAFNGTLFKASFSLLNTGEYIAIKNASTGTIFDDINYSSAWGANGNNKTLGRNSSGMWEETNASTPGANNTFGSSGPDPEPQPSYGEYNLTINYFPNTTAFGSNYFVNVTFYSGDYSFSKIRIVTYAFSPYIAVNSAGNKISQQFYNADTMKEFSGIQMNENTITNLTFNMESNCNNADPTGTYTGRVRVYDFTNVTDSEWEEIQTADFTFNVSANQNCPPPSPPPISGDGGGGGPSAPPAPSISVDITKYLRAGEDLEIEALVFNSFSVAKEVEIYSYIYRSDGGTEYANTGGATANKQTITLKPNSKTSIKLTNTIKPEAEGAFTLKVRIKDGSKNYDGTETVNIEKFAESEKVSENVEGKNATKTTGPTGFFAANNTLSGAIIAGVSNFISAIINGIAKFIADVLKLIAF